jgi:hypothetical protein
MSRRKNASEGVSAPPRPVQFRLRAICCEILYREACLIAANSPNIIDLEFMPKGLHDAGPDEMHRALQARIDAVPPNVYHAVVLGFGLCSNGTAGLTARQVPVVVPRAHDCITLFLGSKEAYQAYFNQHPGTYFRTTGWHERDFCFQHAGASQRLGTDKTYEEYVHLYGKENADFIAQVLGSWKRNYNRLVYVDVGIASFLPYAAEAEREALEQGWTFERLAGNLALVEALLSGPWLSDQFLVLQPGQRLVPAGNGQVIAAAGA